MDSGSIGISCLPDCRQCNRVKHEGWPTLPHPLSCGPEAFLSSGNMFSINTRGNVWRREDGIFALSGWFASPISAAPQLRSLVCHQFVKDYIYEGKYLILIYCRPSDSVEWSSVAIRSATVSHSSESIHMYIYIFIYERAACVARCYNTHDRSSYVNYAVFTLIVNSC